MNKVQSQPRAIDLTRLDSAETWRTFAPQLHVCDPTMIPKAGFFALPGEHGVRAREQINREGYFHVYGLQWGLDLASMVACIRGLSHAGLSPAFAFLYDEFWIPFWKIAPIISGFLGPYAMLPDFWAWDVAPRNDQAGWAPHRDRGACSLFPDGSPKSLTVWLPLTPATPLSSCMYVVPPAFDKTYGTDNENQYTFDHQDIRALPAMPGDVILWNQALLHWGSRSSPLARESRVSIAAQFQRADQLPMREPLMDPAAMLAFEARLQLIAAQILGQRHLYKLSPAEEKLAMARVGHLVQ